MLDLRRRAQLPCPARPAAAGDDADSRPSSSTLLLAPRRRTGRPGGVRRLQRRRRLAVGARWPRRCVPAFVADGIGVVDVLRAHDGGWCRVPLRAGAPRDRRRSPYDDASHPFAAQAVFEGRVTHASRDELRDTLAALPDVRRVGWACRLARLPEPARQTRAGCRARGGVVRAPRVRPDDDGGRAGARGPSSGSTSATPRSTRSPASPRRDHLQVWAALLRVPPTRRCPTRRR